MSEREPRNVVAVGTWAIDRLAARLGQTPEPITDDDYGTGHLLGAPRDATPDPNDRRFVALYPDTGVVSISSKNVDVTVRNAIAHEARDGILVESQDSSTRVLFLRDGHVAVEIFPSLPSQPLEPPLMAGNRPDEETSASPGSRRPGAADDATRASQQQAETAQTGEQKEKQPRVKFTGRLGAAPHFGTSSKSGLIARFPVAEHTKDDRVTWHRVYSTGERAQHIRDAQLDKGTKVKVDGYRQTRGIKRKDGTMEKQEVVFAVYVEKLGNQWTEEQTANE